MISSKCLTLVGWLVVALSAAHAETFTTWQAAHFTSAEIQDAALSGQTADPDGDGISNLLEYAFAGDPWNAEANLAPVFDLTASNVATLTHRRLRTATDLGFTLQTSKNLYDWQTPNTLVLATDGTAATYDRITLADTQPSTGAACQYVRLQVRLNSPGSNNLPAPSGLAASLKIPLQTALAWQDNSAIESGFLIERSVGSGAWQTRSSVPADVREFVDATISGSQNYQYRVTATSASGNSSPSNIASLTTPLDTDGDLLPDSVEIPLDQGGWGTDPTRPDTDLDGLSDGYEAAQILLAGGGPGGHTGPGNGSGPGGNSESGGSSGRGGFDPLNGDFDGNGIPDGEEDWDGDGLTNSEEEYLGTYPGSVEIIPRYTVIPIGNRPFDGAQSEYIGISDSGILSKHDGTVWKQGGTNHLGNDYVTALSTTGWAAINPNVIYGQPTLKNLNDQTTRALTLHTDAEAQALVTNLPSNTTIGPVTGKTGWVGGVGRDGYAVGYLLDDIQTTTTDAQGNSVMGNRFVIEFGYWDLQNILHTLDANFNQPWMLKMEFINTQGTIAGKLTGWDPSLNQSVDQSVTWSTFGNSRTTLPNGTSIIGLNERNEQLQRSASQNKLEIKGIKTYELDYCFSAAQNEATAPQPSANGTLQTAPYTQITGTIYDGTISTAKLYIKSLGEDEYVAIDLDKRLATAEPGTRLISGNAISNTGLILAGRQKTDSGGSKTVEDVILLPVEFKVNAKPYLDKNQKPLPIMGSVKDLLSVWSDGGAGTKLKIKIILPEGFPAGLPEHFIKWSATDYNQTIPDNSAEWEFEWSGTSGRKVITIEMGGMKKLIHVDIPNVGGTSEFSTSLAIKTKHEWFAVASYSLMADTWLDTLSGYSPAALNALKHSYWNAMGASSTAVGFERMQAFSTAHEFQNKRDDQQTIAQQDGDDWPYMGAYNNTMDMHNNEVGLLTVHTTSVGAPDEAAIKSDLLGKLRDGRLMIWDGPGRWDSGDDKKTNRFLKKSNGKPIYED